MQLNYNTIDERSELSPKCYGKSGTNQKAKWVYNFCN